MRITQLKIPSPPPKKSGKGFDAFTRLPEKKDFNCLYLFFYLSIQILLIKHISLSFRHFYYHISIPAHSALQIHLHVMHHW